jgi:hypothetical protein
MTQNPFAAASPGSDAAFTAAAARFFDLLRVFSAQPSAAQAQPPDWTSFGSLLAGQFEQWLKSSPAAGASFAAATGLSGALPGWPPGALPLGPAAAHGADGQSAWELLMKLGELQGELARHWSAIAQDSAQRFIARIGAGAGAGAGADLSPEGALALYETWVACAEEAYGVRVRQEDFCRLQAQLTNTAMALLLAQRKQADALARGLGLPTREEADAMQRRLRELERRLEEPGQPAGTARRHAASHRRQKPQAAKRPAAAAGRSRRRGAPRGHR